MQRVGKESKTVHDTLLSLLLSRKYSGMKIGSDLNGAYVGRPDLCHSLLYFFESHFYPGFCVAPISYAQ